MSSPVLHVEGLSAGYSGADVLRGLDLDVGAGEIVGLVGPSGSGKSTALLALMADESSGVVLTGGRTRVDGEDLHAMAPAERRRYWGSTICYVPQNAGLSLNPSLTVRAHLSETLRVHGRSSPTAEELRASLREVELPSDDAFLSRIPAALSGGQQQRVNFAIALACRPRVLLLDEPTTGLDPITQRAVSTLLRRIVVERGLAAVFVSHDLPLLSSLADRIAILDGGRVVETLETPIGSRPIVHPATRQLISAVPRLSAGSEREPAPVPADDPVPRLAVRGLRVRHRGASGVTLDDVDLSVAPGSTLSVVGHSGSGKSTLIRTIAGFVRPERGSVQLDGRVLDRSIRRRRRSDLRSVQLIFQNPGSALSPRQEVETILERPLRLLRPEFGAKERSKMIRDALDAVHLPSDAVGRLPAELSGGQQQRVAIARAVIVSPSVLLCDEVTSALDVSVQLTVLDIIKELQERTKMSVLFVTHDLALANYVSDEVAVLEKGRVVESGRTADVVFHPRSDYGRALLGAVPRLEGWPEPSADR